MNKTTILLIVSVLASPFAALNAVAQDSYFEPKAAIHSSSKKTISNVELVAPQAPPPKPSVLDATPGNQSREIAHDLEANISGTSIQPGWWSDFVTQPMEEGASVVTLNLEQAIGLALSHSLQLAVEREVPMIRETSVAEADATFDWTSYLESKWE